MNLIIILLSFIGTIFRSIRRLLLRNARVIVPVAVLFTLGYIVGYSFVRFGAPSELKLMGGIVFVVLGFKDVLKFFEEIFPSKRK